MNQNVKCKRKKKKEKILKLLIVKATAKEMVIHTKIF